MTNPEFKDYSHEVRIIRSRPLRYLFWTIATLCLLLGVIGAFLPVLPTTPFVLLAAVFYARSSSNFYNWLMNHRWFGTALRDWIENRSIKTKSKVIAISLISCTLFPSIYLFVPIMAIKIGLGIFGFLLMLFIATRPSGAKK